ncbi:MAG: hypothetical protein FD153_2057, partial [Rhodospirillaceae bacterium]
MDFILSRLDRLHPPPGGDPPSRGRACSLLQGEEVCLMGKATILHRAGADLYA